jgi:hypothetical protein
MDVDFGLRRRELSIIKRLSGPEKIQRFLDYDIGYNKEVGGESCRSPRRVLRDRLAHCAEGAFFAAAALRVHGHEPLIVDLEAVRDVDHLLAVFKEHGRWGAIAKSNYSGLRYREPVYRTIRELVMSYYEHYYNPAGEKTLRAASLQWVFRPLLHAGSDAYPGRAQYFDGHPDACACWLMDVEMC